jgi:hypothetical protein
MTTRVPLALLATILGLLSAGCRETRQAAVPAGATENAWKARTWEEHHDVMTFAVLPTMSRTFQRFAGTVDPEMTCRTCHGPDAEVARYAMPRGLPALDPNRMPDPNARDAHEARMAKFMIEEVTPTMADLLGVPRYDPKTKVGFSCFACHPSR